MKEGTSEQSKKFRYDMLSFHLGTIVKHMTDSGFDNPIGLIIDTSDNYGSQIAKAAAQERGIDYQQHLDTCIAENTIPTMLLVLPFEMARQLLQLTANNASSHLRTPLPPDAHWVVCVAAGGNTYAGIRLSMDRPRGVVPGQHRV